MQPLLVVISTWLSINFGLPAADGLPQVELVSGQKMAEVRSERLASNPARDIDLGTGWQTSSTGGDVFAIYDDATQTIFLHENWSAATPAKSSLLVHEMVHHLQNLAGMTFACAGERESMAYEAQRAWLGLFGRSLEEEFGLDAMTIKLRTSCFY
jgi:hypothetical protein